MLSNYVLQGDLKARLGGAVDSSRDSFYTPLIWALGVIRQRPDIKIRSGHEPGVYGLVPLLLTAPFLR